MSQNLINNQATSPITQEFNIISDLGLGYQQTLNGCLYPIKVSITAWLLHVNSQII